MTRPDDSRLAIAARIADGSAIDWSATESRVTDPGDRAVLEELRAIAALATLHRAPAPWPIEATPTETTRWGPLTVIRIVGRGRFGDVYLAWDARLERRVALKRLHFGSSATTDSPAHAIEEARLLARVRHPNVLAVYGAECIDGEVGIWTEFIEGRTLEAVLADDGPMPAGEVTNIGSDLARALDAVHAAGLLHRDIKAQNVMRETGGRIVLMDFGTGHDLAIAPRAGDLSGTPLYLAPEIFTGESATVASDLYALGVFLFRLLTSRFPVEGRTLEDVRAAHEGARTLALGDLRPDLPLALSRAIERALSRDPSQRFNSAASMAEALGKACPARPVRSPWTRPVIAAASLALISVAAAMWWGTLGLGSTRSGPDVPVQPTTATGTSLHQIDSTKFMLIGTPSPDGSWLPVSNWPPVALDIVLLDARTGRPRVEPKKASDDSGGLSLRAVFSPDGRRLAYDWLTFLSPGKSDVELRILDVATMEARTLEQRAIHPIGWTADGNSLLVRSETNDIAWVDVATGRLSTLGRLPATPLFVSYSPDGKQLVFDQPASAGSTDRDVFMADLATWGVRLLVRHPAIDVKPVWTPDGNGVIFASSRAGSLGLWRVDVTGGEASGEPRLVQANIGKYNPVGFDSGGSLYYKLNGPIEVYTADVNLRRGGVTNVKVASLSYLGTNLYSDWSPDGRKLAYVSRRAEVPFIAGSQAVVVRDLESGGERVFPTFLVIGHLRWSPDGERIILPGDGPEGPGNYLLTLADGSVRPLILAARRPNYPSWMPDGRTMLFLQRGGSTSMIHSFDMSTRAIRPIVPDAGKFVISRSGDRIAFRIEEGPSRGQLGVWDARTNVRVEFDRDELERWLEVAGWSPDDSEVVVFHRLGFQDTELVAFPSHGGPARSLGHIPAEAARSVRLNPAGTRISFEAGTGDWTTWVMRGFADRASTGR